MLPPERLQYLLSLIAKPGGPGGGVRHHNKTVLVQVCNPHVD